MQDVLNKYCSHDLMLIMLSNLVLYQDYLYRLMTNTYSNYFMQTYFQQSETGFKEKVIIKMFSLQSNFVKISVNKVGTYCM